MSNTIRPDETVLDFMLRVPDHINERLYNFPDMSDEAKALFKAFDFRDDANPTDLIPVIEVEKLFEPFSWWSAGPTGALSWLQTLRLAYLLGRMDGKREERAKRHRTKSA